jgi:hypothetical protein
LPDYAIPAGNDIALFNGKVGRVFKNGPGNAGGAAKSRKTVLAFGRGICVCVVTDRAVFHDSVVEIIGCMGRLLLSGNPMSFLWLFSEKFIYFLR